MSGRYASALFELAEARKHLDSVATELRALKELIDESEDLRRLLRSPLYNRDQQVKAMSAVMDKAAVSDLTQRFVLVVAGNRRLFALPQMIDAYLDELARRRGEITARVTAARDLTDAQQDALTRSLRALVGSKVQVDLDVDPSLLGGLVVRVGSRMIDTSLRTKLERLRFAMKGVA